ncbi:hypothetical protein [Glaesserella sp.]|uniref:hypothetical protein n=1 Tax=Glaesserella sp. TaxID=2094731 RepID=UPI0035A16727
MRGQLTEQIKQKSQDLLGYEITQKELRLIPYVLYCVMNASSIERARVNKEEFEILDQWEAKGFIQRNRTHLKISKSFYDASNELLWFSYIVGADINL